MCVYQRSVEETLEPRAGIYLAAENTYFVAFFFQVLIKNKIKFLLFFITF